MELIVVEMLLVKTMHGRTYSVLHGAGAFLLWMLKVVRKAKGLTFSKASESLPQPYGGTSAPRMVRSHLTIRWNCWKRLDAPVCLWVGSQALLGTHAL